VLRLKIRGALPARPFYVFTTHCIGTDTPWYIQANSGIVSQNRPQSPAFLLTLHNHLHMSFIAM